MKKILLAAGAILMVAACAKEAVNIDTPEDVTSKNGTMQTVAVNVVPFYNIDTKTSVTVDTEASPQTAVYSWNADDEIGIYPVATDALAGQSSQQIVFKINGSGESASATFNGTGWGLITNGDYEYFSYYPYSSAAEYDEVDFSFADGLNQTANANTEHLTGMDYLCASKISPTDPESASFTFQHITALVEFAITVPEAVQEKKFIRMRVTAPDDVFITDGIYDPTSLTVSDDTPPVVSVDIKAGTTTDVLNLYFNSKVEESLRGFKPDDNGVIRAFFLMAPAAVNGKELTIELWDADNKAYVATKTPKSDISSNNFKIYNCEVEAKGETYLSASGTANCYIVPENGQYRFLANVKGNGYDPLDDVNHNEDAAIDVTGCTAEVLWETINTDTEPTEGGIVSSVEIDGDCIVFNATGTQGNALIALKKGDDIVWSWHIWSTNANLKNLAQTYPNNVGVVMDRNLGALSSTVNDPLAIGLFYQWGRHCPFMGGYDFSTYTLNAPLAATTNSDEWVDVETTNSTGTIEYSVAHPMHYLCGSDDNYVGDTETLSWSWLWMTNTYSIHPPLWGSIKTMYDPCPFGWKVPDSNFFTGAGFSDGTVIYDSEINGFSFDFGDDSSYYPTTGYRCYPNKLPSTLCFPKNKCNLWLSNVVSGFSGGCCNLNSNNNKIYASSYSEIRTAIPVRPCKVNE